MEPKCQDCETYGDDDNPLGTLRDFTWLCEACWEGRLFDDYRATEFGEVR